MLRNIGIVGEKALARHTNRQRQASTLPTHPQQNKNAALAQCSFLWASSPIKFSSQPALAKSLVFMAFSKANPMTTLAQFTEAALLVPRLAGDHRESVIAELSQRLKNLGRIDSVETFNIAVMEHEELAPAIFDGVAFPLAHKGAFKELSFAVGLAPQPIHWGTPHAPLVHTVVLFAVPPSEEKRYFSLVFAFSNFLKDGKKFTALRACVRPEEMLEVLGRIHF
jgi:mannitol/fructose-specific phosphotransferase system IIA component (Ntr-type)